MFYFMIVQKNWFVSVTDITISHTVTAIIGMYNQIMPAGKFSFNTGI